LTTNKAFKDWGEVFQDNAVATAIAERLIEHGLCAATHNPCYVVSPVMCCPALSPDYAFNH
jgi:hypothetical protein